MLRFETVQSLVDSLRADAAVWVANDGASGYIYEHADQMEEHAAMGAAGDPTAPSGAQQFEVECAEGDLVQALIDAGIDYETQ